MSTLKLKPGERFPDIEIATIDYGKLTLGQQAQGWQLILVYRGLHCPWCRTYIDQLHQITPRFRERDVQVIAISGDPEEKAVALKREAGYRHLPIGYGLSLTQMHRLGLFISAPRSPEETNQPFAEPAVFLINPEKTVQIAEYSNAPFCRPDLNTLLEGIIFIQEHKYPIRGRYE
ncbi:MAG: redoxin domain-containing protein [Pontibacterium sp.]